MITNIWLEKFQGYEKRQNVMLAPITLVFGPNSSGKSSLIRSMLFLKQSWAPFYSSDAGFVYKGQDVDLASFNNVVNKHSDDGIIRIGLTIEERTNIERPIYSRFPINTRLIKFLTLEWAVSEGNTFGKFKVDIQVESDASDTISLLFESKSESIAKWNFVSGQRLERLGDLFANIATKKGPASLRSIEPDWENIDWLGLLGRLEWRQSGIFIAPEDRSRVAAHTAAPGLDEVTALFTYIANTFRAHLETISHIGPIRPIPERLEISSSEPSRSRLRRPGDNSKKSAALAADLVKELTGGQYEIRTIKIRPSEAKHLGELTAHMLFDTHNQTEVTYRDVGVGISQVLPFLQSLALPTKTPSNLVGGSPRVLLVEQPELHLHPKLQAALMDVMIESVFEQSNAARQIIAETHSESMILRLQKRIREGRLSAADVSIVFAERDPSGTGNKIYNIPIDDNGDLTEGWPESFADLRIQDLY